MQRPDVNNQTVHPLAEVDVTSWKGFPGLRSFFLDLRYAGCETEREPGLLMVSVGPTGWVWTLKDGTAATQLRITAPTIDEVQLLAEALLNDKRAPWVPDLYARSKRNGRKK